MLLAKNQKDIAQQVFIEGITPWVFLPLSLLLKKSSTFKVPCCYEYFLLNRLNSSPSRYRSNIFVHRFCHYLRFGHWQRVIIFHYRLKANILLSSLDSHSLCLYAVCSFRVTLPHGVLRPQISLRRGLSRTRPIKIRIKVLLGCKVNK